MASSQGMQVLHSPARTVVVVGPGGGGDIAALAGAVAAEKGALVVLAIGWPPTSAQQDVIHEAMRATAELRLAFEAHLLYGEAELEDHLLAGDKVVGAVAAGPEETTAPQPVGSFA
jgi:predicted nicotinamide N-methyase